MSARIEMGTREALAAVVFVGLVFLALLAAQAGMIKYPLVTGIVLMLAVGMIFIGQMLVQRGVISKTTLPLWYLMSVGMTLVIYGAIKTGALPAAFIIPGASASAIALASAALYTLLVLAVVAAVAFAYAAYQYYKRRALGLHVS